jgi:uncharacterized protein
MMRVDAPMHMPLYQRFRSTQGEHVLVVPYSRIYDLPAEWLDENGSLSADAHHMIDALAQRTQHEDALEQVPLPPVRSLSLNVSSACNLACSYCYAGGGGFEGRQKAVMDWPVARQAVDRLLDEAVPGERSTIGFLGGEPFVNRKLIRQVTEYASAKADACGVLMQFSVTTNGTLLNDEDRALLREHTFAVTISVDGARETQDRYRPMRAIGSQARSSWDALNDAVAPLLADPGRAKIGARATVGRDAIDLRASFDSILRIGFAEVGFSPLRQSRDAGRAMTDADWPAYLAALQDLAATEMSRVLAGQQIRLTNFAVALRQLHRGWSAPYGCGAGGGYFSVASDGTWYACHRAVGDPAYRMGDNRQMDAGARRQFLMARHVHAQTDCNKCWARYLCSGGCHQEAATRTPESCDFIRGWLLFCMAAYCEVSAKAPEWFAPGTPALSKERNDGHDAT